MLNSSSDCYFLRALEGLYEVATMLASKMQVSGVDCEVTPLAGLDLGLDLGLGHSGGFRPQPQLFCLRFCY